MNALQLRKKRVVKARTATVESSIYNSFNSFNFPRIITKIPFRKTLLLRMEIAPYIHISKNIAATITSFLQNNTCTKVVVLVDENTIQHCYPIIKNALPANHGLIEVKSGEEAKNLQTCTHIWSEMTEMGLDRKALLLNLGGGVIGDMGGFCAATYKRGIRFAQIPTTLLSMVDASVGGKLGVDFMGYKNHIGVFQEPLGVLIDPIFLNTLPQRELRSGFAEVLKHSLIADVNHWNEIKTKNLADFDWASIIKHSVGIKSYVTTTDPTEKGLRKILNFGHTLGHAVESFYLELPSKRLLHGEAIAVGMIVEAWLSKQLGFIAETELNEITATFLRVYGKVTIHETDLDAIITHTLQDKKNENNVVQFALLENIGKANYEIPVNAAQMKDSLQYYRAL
jgi:3-dehydroquinate synthase